MRTIEDRLAAAMALLRSGATLEGESEVAAVLQVEPQNAKALNLLGVARMQQRDFRGAGARFAAAAALDTGNAEYLSNLASAHIMVGDYSAAEATARRALAIDPARADAHANLGTAQRRLGRPDEALESYRVAAGLRPDVSSYRNNFGDLLLMLGRLEPAIAELRAVLALQPTNLKARSDLIMALNYAEDVGGDELLAEAREFGRLVTARATGANIGTAPSRSAGEPLRVGFLSGDLRRHSVAHFIEGPLRALRDRGHQAFAYATRSGSDDVTARLRPLFSGWRDISGLGDPEAARLIASDRVHILIDLSGHTGANRLSLIAYRSAPVTATWIGYSGTTGLAEMDYILADPVVLPPGDERFHTEAPIRLPDTYLLFQPPEAPPPVPPMPAIANGYVTFGSFNNLTKLSNATIATWARLLGEVAHSRLVLKSPTLAVDHARRLVDARFAAHGIGPDRLTVLGSIADPGAHLAAYGKIDIALDPFPYAGTTTTCEALWMGRPVVSLRGERFTARVGDSLLTSAGLGDWVAGDRDAYVALAAERAADRTALAVLSGTLRERVRQSPLVDAVRFAANLEAALEAMWAAGPRRGGDLPAVLLREFSA